MSRYHLRLINELRMQLSYSPERRRQEQLSRLEEMLPEIKPGRTYRYDLVALDITNYKSAKSPGDKLPGGLLRHDLAILIEDLSFLLDTEAADLGEPVFTEDQLRDMFDISPRMVFDLRLDGLPVRYYIADDGEKRMGVRQSVLDAYMARIVAAAVRSPRFTRAPERKILLEAERLLARNPEFSLTELSAELEQKFGLPEYALKYIIIQHDRREPQAALFHDTHDPLSAALKAEVVAAHREGESPQRLMARYGRDRQEIYRVIRQVKAERIMGDGIQFIYNDEFDASDADQRILGIAPEDDDRKPVGHRDAHVPAYLTDLCKVPLLGRDEEPELFRRYNYLKYRLNRIWEDTRPSQLSSALLEDMRWLRNEYTELRNRILEANLRLVIRMAYKHVGPLANVNELISDGNVSLMQAVEKFDYAKGFRFSTYASWALLKNFAKTIPEDNYRGEKFVTGQADLLDCVPDAKNSAKREELATSMRGAINRVLSKLSARERQVVRSRFGIGAEDHAQTLGEVGKDMNVTRERVRQLEARALEKMRTLLQKESIELEI